MAIKKGLQVRQTLRLKIVQVFSDSMEAIDSMLKDCGLDHPYRSEIEYMNSEAG